VASKTVQIQIQKVTEAFLLDHIDRKLPVDFENLRDHINKCFPGVKHNWLVTVRSPLQSFINQGKLARDTTDIRGPELYKVL